MSSCCTPQLHSEAATQAAVAAWMCDIAGGCWGSGNLTFGTLCDVSNCPSTTPIRQHFTVSSSLLLLCYNKTFRRPSSCRSSRLHIHERVQISVKLDVTSCHSARAHSLSRKGAYVAHVNIPWGPTLTERMGYSSTFLAHKVPSMQWIPL